MHVFLWLGVLVPVAVAGVGTAMAAPAVDPSAREREIDDAVCEDFDRAAKWPQPAFGGGHDRWRWPVRRPHRVRERGARKGARARDTRLAAWWRRRGQRWSV